MVRVPGWGRGPIVQWICRIGVFLALPLILFSSLLTSCGTDTNTRPLVIANNPPVIARIFLNPQRVHTDQEITVAVAATDADGDRLFYLWSATRGTFPFGRTIPSVPWKTAVEHGIDTLQILVTDVEDTTRLFLPVVMVMPAEPDTVTTRNSTTLVDVFWRRSIDDGIIHWKGYEVYMGEESLLGLSETELANHLITPEPIRQTRLKITDLNPGTKYYFHVRSKRVVGETVERSVASIEVDMSPRPEFVRPSFRELGSDLGGHALDLSAGRVRSLDPADASGIESRDIFLSPQPGDPEGPLWLRSVSLLAAENPEWAGRETLIKVLGGPWESSTTDDTGWMTEVLVEKDLIYAVKSKEGNFAKLRINAISLFPPNRQVWVEWAYQTIPEYPSF